MVKVGDKVSFYENGEIREAVFLCSSEGKSLEPEQLIDGLLNSEQDLKYFCQSRSLKCGSIYM